LTQKEEDSKYSCLPVFEHIQKNIFGCGNLNWKQTKSSSNQYIELRSSGLSNDLSQIHNYFDNFILKTSKINSFLLQKEVIYRLKNSKKITCSFNKGKYLEQLISLIKHSIKKNKGYKKD